MFLSEAVSAKPRPALPPRPEQVLSLWRFDTPDWQFQPNRAPLLEHNIGLAESWSGYAVVVAGLNPARLVFPNVSSSGHPNLTPAAGSISFWFSPYWASASVGGKGPGGAACLLESGTWAAREAVGLWSLQLSGDGNHLALVASDGRLDQTPVLTAPVNWGASQWHQVVLTYSAQSTALYVDGVPVVAGPGIQFTSPIGNNGKAGLAVGSDVAGGNLAQGQFDELTTFDTALPGAQIAARYVALREQAALGPISPKEEAVFAAMAKSMMEAALTEAAQAPPGGSMQMMMSCPELKLLIVRLSNATLRLSICGGNPNSKYDLITLANLNTSQNLQTWTWLATMGSADEVIVNPTDPARFYQLVEAIDPDKPGLFTFYVAPYVVPGADGSRDLPFPNLQAALASPAVVNGSVIRVLPGVYAGPTNCNLNFTGRELTLVSERGWENTTIDCGAVPNSQAFIFNSPSTLIRGVVAGFTIRNAPNSAVSCSNGSQPLFARCMFRQNTSQGAGAAVSCNAADPWFVNCSFVNNTTPLQGGAIFATGADSLVRISHCTFTENQRGVGGGTLSAQNGATMNLLNSIVWSTFPAQGAEIVTGGGGVITANYCDIRGGFGGTGNLNADPLFEANGTQRLRINSPCIDQGTPITFPGLGLLSRFDLDDEQRLDHGNFANAVSTVDIGADEFVYRIAFPVVMATVYVPNGYGRFIPTTKFVSEVDEASGVSFLASTATGPLITIVDDEDRNGFRIYQLNADASAIAIPSIPVSTLNPAYPNANDQEIADMEGVTFDPATRQLYVLTSQTKRNRYRNVDASPPVLDPVIDPPSSDYDRRRTVLVRLQMDAALTTVTGSAFFESENRPVPYNAAFNPVNGLAAYVPQQFQNLPRLGGVILGTRVLIARNTVNKFGTPVDGTDYPAGTPLPYSMGGPTLTAGISVGSIGPFALNGTITDNGIVPATVYFYKIWAADANFNYYPGPVAVATNNGRAVVYINEFDAAGDNETVEFYNPSQVAVNVGGCFLSDNPLLPTKYTIPAGTTIPSRGVWTINDAAFGFHFADGGGENIALTWTDMVSTLDEWNMSPPMGGINEGRAWDGGPHGFVTIISNFNSCLYETLVPASPYPPNLGALNHPQPRKNFDAVPNVNQAAIYLTWDDIGFLPSVWDISPKQHDFHAINIEDIAYRNANEMILGLRSPLVNRTNGNAFFFRVSNVATFLTAPWPAGNNLQGIGPRQEMVLGGLGIRSIKWCPQLGPGAVGRYLVLAGNANGGPLVRENARQKFSLYAWDGASPNNQAQPQLLIDDLDGYAVRPEGLDLINVQGQWRILFVEDRFESEGYATRNAIHWPLNILGTVN